MDVFACCVEQLDETEDRIGAHTIQRSLALLTARPTLSRRLGPNVNRPGASDLPPCPSILRWVGIRNHQIRCYLRAAATFGQFLVSFDLETTCFVANAI
jgi:hypothetical protein